MKVMAKSRQRALVDVSLTLLLIGCLLQAANCGRRKAKNQKNSPNSEGSPGNTEDSPHDPFAQSLNLDQADLASVDSFMLQFHGSKLFGPFIGQAEKKYLEALEKRNPSKDPVQAKSDRLSQLKASCENIWKKLETIRREDGGWPEDMPKRWQEKQEMCAIYTGHKTDDRDASKMDNSGAIFRDDMWDDIITIPDEYQTDNGDDSDDGFWS